MSHDVRGRWYVGAAAALVFFAACESGSESGTDAGEMGGPSSEGGTPDAQDGGARPDGSTDTDAGREGDASTGDADGAAGHDGGPTAVGSADLGDDPNPNQADFLSALSQTFPVAIYQVPDENPGWYGAGTLTIGGTTSNWTIELRGADDSVIVSVSAEGAITNALTPFSQQSFGGNPVPLPGQVFINRGVGVDQYVNVAVDGFSGLLEGSAGGQGEVLFRNRLDAYGPSVPAVFADLAGTWTGTTQIACPPPSLAAQTNTVTITADGRVTMEGQTQLCGGSLPREVEWAGSDDFLKPEDDDPDYAYVMHMDARDALNVSDGVFQVLFDEDMEVVRMRGFIDSELYELQNPVKQ